METSFELEGSFLADNESRHLTSCRRSIDRLLPGDRIRIRRGSLVEATGIVVGLTGEQKCILKIDGLGEGVFVIVAPAALQLTEEWSSAPAT